MLVKKEQIKSADKRIKFLLCGVPGSGKTTLALSSKRPLLIDIDEGVDRVSVKYRSDVDKVKTYDELIEDLKSPMINDYDTIVVDTGGKLFDKIIKAKVIEQNPKNGQTDGSLSLKGYGAAYVLFKNLVAFIDKLGKDQIYIFHANEQSNKVNNEDVISYRLQIEGKTRQEIWNDMDLGAMLEIVGNKRVLHFKQCDRYFAKGNHGINGDYDVPTLNGSNKNNFLTLLFEKYRQNIAHEELEGNEELEKYETIMQEGHRIIEGACIGKITFDRASEELSKLNFVSTSKQELLSELMSKAKESGFTYDKQSKTFINNGNTTK